MTYLRFIKWEGEYALFRKANISEIVAVLTGINALCNMLGLSERIIIIDFPEEDYNVKKTEKASRSKKREIQQKN